jgi:hypothetical protein
VAHEDVYRVVDRQPDEEDGDGDEQLVEGDAEPPHEAEGDREDEPDARDAEQDVDHVAVGDGQHQQDEQDGDGADDDEAVLHRAAHLVGDDARAEDQPLTVEFRLGEGLDGDL